jgi:glycosyltransferase involved in cell wall biosynthesis
MQRKQRFEQNQVFISCIVPAYNEQAGIGPFLQELHDELINLKQPFEIVVVDDGSQDQTTNIVTSLVQQYPGKIKLLSFSRNFGKEVALTAGLEHCKGDVAILIDADHQHPFAVIQQFLAHWRDGYDMVYGVRKDRKDETFVKRSFSKFFYWLMAKLTTVTIPAHAGDFRLLDRKIIDAIVNCKERDRFMKGLYAWTGFNSIAVPFEVQERKTGESSWHFFKLTNRFNFFFQRAVTDVGFYRFNYFFNFIRVCNLYYIKNFNLWC